MIPGTLLSAGTTPTAIINQVRYWYRSVNVNYITGRIGARQRVFILVAPRGSEHFVDQSIDASNLSPPRGRIHIVSSRPSSIFNGLARHEAGWSWVDHTYVEVEGPSSHVSCCCVLSMRTILRTRRDATYNTMCTLIKTYVSNPSSRATSRHPDDGSTSYLGGRPLSMALPDTKRVGRGLIICRGGRPVVTCIVSLLCDLVFYDNDTTYYVHDEMRRRVV